MGGVEEIHGDPTVGPPPKSGPDIKNGSSAKDGAPKRLRCGTIQKEVRSCKGWLQSLPFYPA